MKLLLRIKDIREKRELPQKAVAAYLQCDQSLYSKYENGVRDFPLRYARMLAEYYDVSIDYLVGLTDIEKPYPRKS